ncbi:MAG: hypothetical protein RMY64_36650 [Nostoc sp. DedQUE08]|uniref:hypothetical protein n=1 Tax=Nostoc sp. DedQUE08 TaxID=3075393 RepID=UPI002AD31243|nr:hypothetical protein [Nostoc sp. DedQUE08]MDZ8071092.1 hypothetical protein [Nostoc sp. DedQUE08]
MSLPMKTAREQKIDEVMQSLQRARDLVRSREEFGVDGIDNFVQNVEGDWLERWPAESSLSLQETIQSGLIKFVCCLMAFKGCKSNNPKMLMQFIV